MITDIKLTNEELETAISALLFSCSVNVVSNTDPNFQTKLFSLATKLKTYKPDIELKNIQFIQEENYEETLSEEVLNNFKDNIKIVTFEQV